MVLPITNISEHGKIEDVAHERAEHALQDVKRIVAIHSGKGGVGKTFLTCNIAYALAQLHGLSVGILDADVDCPNVPRFLGIDKDPSIVLMTNNKRFVPIQHRGVSIVSTGLLEQAKQAPLMLRGPAKHRVILDMLTNTNWGALDVLLIDLPPGTSDVPMSLLEFGNINGIVFVTTPQKESLIDTAKSIQMSKQFGIHELGVVENMSGGVFGVGGALFLAEQFSVPYLCALPLNKQIFECNERGDIAFLLPQMEDVVRPILDAIRPV